jgi:hypothetical protein
LASPVQQVQTVGVATDPNNYGGYRGRSPKDCSGRVVVLATTSSAGASTLVLSSGLLESSANHFSVVGCLAPIAASRNRSAVERGQQAILAVNRLGVHCRPYTKDGRCQQRSGVVIRHLDPTAWARSPHRGVALLAELG